MDRFDKEIEIKLDILASLARSQQALAKIIECMADVAALSEQTAEQLAENIETIAQYQRALADKISGIRIPKRKSSVPGAPWIPAKVKRLYRIT